MKVFGMTDVGNVRKKNEDTIFISKNDIGTLKNLCIVADGVGGEKRGDVASAYATEKFCSQIIEYKGEELEVVNLLEYGISQINKYINYKSDNSYEFKGMSTTFLAVTIDGDKLYAVNVGDSRLYRLRDNKLDQITVDNTYYNEMKKANVDNVNKKYEKMLSRSVGYINKIEVDKYELNINKSDIFIMCSDGLTDMLDEKEMYEILKETFSIEENVKKLVQMAKDKGGKDNISIIIIEN